VVGSGPEETALKQLASSLNIGDRVQFWGKLSRPEALDKLAQASVLVHPSLHDSGGWVCLEAMAAGRPVVCLDLGGPGEQVTAATGFKVAATHPLDAVQQLAQAMQQLAQNTRLISQMGQAGQAHVKANYCWEGRAVWLNQLYEKVVKDYAG
jgi:glycosyltransferase involved in cell wall biosynthesis